MNRLRIFNTLTWRIVSEFGCGATCRDEKYKTKSTICYQEVALDPEQAPTEEDGLHEKTRYVLREIGALQIGEGKGKRRSPNKGSAKRRRVNGTGSTKGKGGEQPLQIGVSKCEWSHDSRFLAVVSDANEQVIWIWDLKYLVFHSILAHRESIRAIEWNAANGKLQLAISCNNDRLYLWSKSGAVVIRVVASRFSVRRVSWRPSAGAKSNGRTKSKKSKYQNMVSKDCICLIDRNHFCCCYDLDF